MASSPGTSRTDMKQPRMVMKSGGLIKDRGYLKDDGNSL